MPTTDEPPPPETTPPSGGAAFWLFGIQARIFLALALLATLLLFAVAWAIEREAGRELETELTLRLHAVGGAAENALGRSLVPALLVPAPQGPESPFLRDRRVVLTQLRDRTGVRRIFLADTTGRSFVDTDPRVAAGTPMTQLRSDRVEVRAVLRGNAAAAPMFIDADGQPRKTGYVPVVADGRTIALIGVEADATFLRAVRALRSRILTLGLLGILAAFLLAAPVARGLTRPIGQLVQWARGFGGGDLTRPAPSRGRDELAFLGRTLEQMRVNLADRDREQRAMAAGVAHEIRNPLGGIRLYAELLAADATLSDQARERLRKMLTEMNRIGSIVDEFLLFARPTAAEPTANPLGEVVSEILDWIAPVAAARGVDLAAIPPQGGWPTAAADPNHLRQILRNLIQNAVEACGPGHRVRVGAGVEGGSVRVWVDDDGPGMGPEARERLFEPFFTTKATGAGLGLAIVRRLALSNGAQVAVEPRNGPGVRFVVTFGRRPGGGSGAVVEAG